MSIHQKGSIVTFKWAIPPTGSPLLKTDFDIELITPSNTAIYTNDGVTTYIAPTATTKGLVTYNLALTQVGRYVVKLTTGVASSFVSQAARTVFSVVVPEYVLNGADAVNTQGPGVIPDEAIWVPPTHHIGLPSAVYSGNSKASQLGSTFGVFIRPDTGLTTYLTRTGIVTNTHAMSVAWQLDGTAQSGQRNQQNDGKLGTDMTFSLGASPDVGKHIYFCFDEIPAPTFDYNISEFNGSTSWNLSTFPTTNPSREFDASPTVEEAVGIAWSDDGTKCFIVDRATKRVTEWDAGTPYYVDSLVYNSVFYDFSGQDSTLKGIHFNVDGTSFYMVTAGSTLVYQFNLTVAWDLSTCSYSGDNFNCSPTCSNLTNIFVRPDETSFYVQDATANRTYQFNM